jgi:hypothetical protein
MIMTKIFRYSLVFLALAWSLAPAYDEPSLPDIVLPTGLTPGSLEDFFSHRFYGSINAPDPFKTLFGIQQGANATLGLRLQPVRNLEVSTAYFTLRREVNAGISCALSKPASPLSLQINGTYYNLDKDYLQEIRISSFYGLLSAGCNLQNVIFPTVSFGYDGYEQCMLLGTGLTLRLLGTLDLFGEYLPVLADSASRYGGLNTYSFGFKIMTAGHQFLVFAGNTDQLGPRAVMLGSRSKDLHLGFLLKRLFVF